MADSSALTALADFAGAMLPLSARDLQTRIDEQLSKVPNSLNEFGFDGYGMSPQWMRRFLLPGALLYRHYFRVETFDIDRLPQGRVLLIANHAGQLPFDGAMLAMALLLEATPPRIARAMGEYWIPQLPWVGVAAARGGALVGTPQNCTHMLQNEECVVAFPEGVRGMNKLFRQRYQLQRFGMGFMRLALESGAPIVPITASASRFKAFRSWDRFQLPHPFARVRITHAKPITVPADAETEAIEQKRVELERALTRITTENDAKVRDGG